MTGGSKLNNCYRAIFRFSNCTRHLFDASDLFIISALKISREKLSDVHVGLKGVSGLH